MIVTSYLTFSLCLVVITGQRGFSLHMQNVRMKRGKDCNEPHFYTFYPVLTDNLFYGLTSVLRLPFIHPAFYYFREKPFANHHRRLLPPYWIVLPISNKTKPLIRNVLIGTYQIKNLILYFIVGADSIAEIQHSHDEAVWPVLLIFCQW